MTEQQRRDVDPREALDALLVPYRYDTVSGVCEVCGKTYNDGHPWSRRLLACWSCQLRQADAEHRVLGLRELREFCRLTQEEAGRVLGFHKNTVAKWERGTQACEHPKMVGLALRAHLLANSPLTRS